MFISYTDAVITM